MNTKLPLSQEQLIDDIDEVLISPDDLHMRVAQMGAAISQDYQHLYPLLVGVLKGVLFFMADLVRAITIPIELDFISISNYSTESRSHGVVRIIKDLEIPISGRHILFIEDVIHTGLTLNYLLQNLRARQPASLEVCVLFNKPEHRLMDIPLKYIGYNLPDRFVVGYGLDYREKYRNLPFIGSLRADILNKKP